MKSRACWPRSRRRCGGSRRWWRVGCRRRSCSRRSPRRSGELLSVESRGMGRYEPDGTVTIVAGWGRAGDRFPVGSRWGLGGKNLATIVFETGRPARIDSLCRCLRPDRCRSPRERGRLRRRDADHRRGPPLGCDDRAPRRRSSRCRRTPRRAWPTSRSWWRRRSRTRESRAELMASRARIVATADETRRRIERDLHDGIQQRLVSLGLEVRAAQATVPPQLGELEGELARVAEGLGERVRRAAGDRPRDSPRDPVRGRPGAGARSAAAPFGGTGRARRARRATAARAGRGGGVLRGVRGVDERRQARARVGRDTSSSTPTTRSCGWRSATTGSGEPTPARGPDCSGSAIESKRSAALCRSPAPLATAPRCWSRSRSKTGQAVSPEP